MSASIPDSPAEFKPARWLPGRHAHTIGARMLRPTLRNISFRRERLTTPDGDFLDLDFADVRGSEWSGHPPEAPIALLLHGLEGSARAGYAQQIYRQLAAEGVRPVGLNFRSCSGEPNQTTRLYHSGETSDAHQAISYLKTRFPSAPMGALGVSLGGNVLLKYLGEQGDDSHIEVAATISVPYDLTACSTALEGRHGHPYGRYLLRSLLAKLKARTDEFRVVLPDVDLALASRTIRAFDQHVTAPIFGFDDAADYYHRCSSARFLERVRRPAALFSAYDDPFVPGLTIPTATISTNAHLELHLTPSGGHVGFVSGPPWRTVFWAEREAAKFVARRLGRMVARRLGRMV
ncbi:MAG: putative alpha/beta-fold hydrolase [Myxococcota bacterium]|jgi:predicted alpha/beta-fold hydrolase